MTQIKNIKDNLRWIRQAIWTKHNLVENYSEKMYLKSICYQLSVILDKC